MFVGAIWQHTKLSSKALALNQDCYCLNQRLLLIINGACRLVAIAGVTFLGWVGWVGWGCGLKALKIAMSYTNFIFQLMGKIFCMEFHRTLWNSTQNFLPIPWKICIYTPAQRSWRSISQVCFRISISYFICMLMVAIGRSLLIFSNVTFKMAAWRPYWIFWFPDFNFTLVLNINFKLQRLNTYVYG